MLDEVFSLAKRYENKTTREENSRLTLDSENKLHGYPTGLERARLNADRIRLIESYRKVKQMENQFLDAKEFIKIDLTDVSTAALFDSFSITAYNLLAMVLYLDYRREDEGTERQATDAQANALKKKIDNYVQLSMPWVNPVIRWRHKVAAHPAALFPRSGSETTTDRDISLLPASVGVEHGRYIAGIVTPLRSGCSMDDSARTLEKWSLTHIFEMLLTQFPWLDDDEFFVSGFPLGNGYEVWGAFELDTDNFMINSEISLPPGSSQTLNLFDRDCPSSRIEVEFIKNIDNTLTSKLKINGKPASLNWVADEIVLKDGTIIRKPD